MGLVTLTKGRVIHKALSDTVSTLEILVKGKIRATDQFTSFYLSIGDIVGLVESPSKEYQYTYEVIEDSSIYVYPYEGTEDLLAMLKCNEKITPILASKSTSTTYAIFHEYKKLYENALFEFKKLKSEYADYPDLCIKAGEIPSRFEKLELIVPPVKNDMLTGWEYDYIKSMKNQEDSLNKSFYSLSQEIAIGTVMISEKNQKLIAVSTKFLTAYKKQLSRNTADFSTAIKAIFAKIEHNENALKNNSDILITDALATILTYSEINSELSSKFQEDIKTFKESDNRYDSSDEARLLRKNISSSFYKIYKKVLLKSISDKNVPIEVKMFLMFGFVDEELAGDKNTSILCNIAKSYSPDPEGNILLVSEWLEKIYRLKAEPSRNEFDQDWPTYLREQKALGSLKQEQIDIMINDPESRLNFEINNLFSLGNRMTFGRVSSFVPIFDSMNVLRSLDLAYMNASKIKEHIANIKKIDFGVFCRESVYSNTDIGITQFYYAEEIEPYVIIMPNTGTRASLWQEIEGKKRNTKARMLISIFNLENTEDCMIKLLGEFRWEMCKTEQGVHWNDVTSPSLTSLYCDYLQFFKKNPSLSSEQKDRLRLYLKKHNNNYKSIFLSDYLSYIKYESKGSLRLSKVTREILFNSCPFSKEYRDAIYDNPQYTELINHYMAHNANLSKPLQNLETRLKRDGLQVPSELTDQINYLVK